MKKDIFKFGVFFLLLTTSIVALSGCKDEEPNKADFIGNYSVMDVCNGDDATYVIMIGDVSGSEDAVTIKNLWDWEETMNGTISGNTITIPSQLSDGLTFSGSGELSGNTLVITYTAVDNVGTENCVASATKQ